MTIETLFATRSGIDRVSKCGNQDFNKIFHRLLQCFNYAFLTKKLTIFLLRNNLKRQAINKKLFTCFSVRVGNKKSSIVKVSFVLVPNASLLGTNVKNCGGKKKRRINQKRKTTHANGSAWDHNEKLGYM